MPYGLWFSRWFTFLDAEYMATLSATVKLSENRRAPREIEVPAPTAWPFILALGAALLFAGLVTSMSVSFFGAVLAVAWLVFRRAERPWRRRRQWPAGPAAPTARSLKRQLGTALSIERQQRPHAAAERRPDATARAPRCR